MPVFYRHVGNQRSAGIRSFVVHGTTGEVLHAPIEERETLSDEIPGLRGEDEFWIAGTGHHDVNQAVRLTERAVERNSADAAMVVTPDFWGTGEYDFREYFGRVLNVGVPTIIYQSPQHGSLDYEFVTRMADRYENFFGVKHWSCSMLLEIRKLVGEGRLMLSLGHDPHINAAAKKGMSVTSGWCNCFPHIVRYIIGNPDNLAVQRELNDFIRETSFEGQSGHPLNPLAIQKATASHISGIDFGEPLRYEPLEQRHMDSYGIWRIRYLLKRLEKTVKPPSYFISSLSSLE